MPLRLSLRILFRPETTPRLCVFRGHIRHFAMVHDSYGVHACDVDLLNRVLREEFVGIYSEPVMANFFKELLKSGGVALPSLPPPGNLDIRQVLASPYFFA